MIAITKGIQGLPELIKDLKKQQKIIAAPNLQVYRANEFKKYTKQLVRTNMAGLKPISSATRILTGEHDPMYLTGKLIEMMRVKPVRGSKGNAADVGYFERSSRIPGKKITWTRLAILHHTGYRIPLWGPKGKRVRAWLAMNGINLFGGMGDDEVSRSDRARKRIHIGSRRHTARWIVVSPRPFFLNTAEKYIAEDLDMKAVEKYFGMLGNQVEAAMKASKGEGV